MIKNYMNGFPEAFTTKTQRKKRGLKKLIRLE